MARPKSTETKQAEVVQAPEATQPDAKKPEGLKYTAIGTSVTPDGKYSVHVLQMQGTTVLSEEVIACEDGKAYAQERFKIESVRKSAILAG